MIYVLYPHVAGNKTRYGRVYLDLWIVNTLIAYTLGRFGGPGTRWVSLQKNLLVRSPQRGRRCVERTVILGRLRLLNPLLLQDTSR